MIKEINQQVKLLRTIIKNTKYPKDRYKLEAKLNRLKANLDSSGRITCWRQTTKLRENSPQQMKFFGQLGTSKQQTISQLTKQ